MYKVIIISIVFMFAVIFVLQQMDPDVRAPDNTTQTSEVSDTNTLTVTIEGEVALPGNYSMQIVETLNDLVIKAGGLLESADQSALNLDVPIESRNYFYVPALSIYSNACEVTTPVEKININTANANQLSTLTYVSLALGEKIVAYREENGSFKTLEEIMNVSGIGRATYERIRDYITLK